MADNDQNKLFVGGISRETTEDTLKSHFVKYGAVVAAAVARDRDTGNPRGFGFVTLEDSSAVDQALEDTHVIFERMVEVKKAIPRSEQHQNQHKTSHLCRNSRSCRSNNEFKTKKIFVGGLAPTLTEREFRGYFERFGGITDVVVMHDNATNRPRGFGFITFDTEEAVEDVTKKSFHELTGKLVEVKRAVPKDGNNSNSPNSYNVGGGSGRDSFNNYQHGNYPPYSPQVGILPGYGPSSGYGGSIGYPYGANYIGGAFPFGGIGYGVTPLAPRSPWIRGGLLPYGNFPPFYPALLNGGAGVRGMGTNGYNGIGGMGINGQFSQVGSCGTIEVKSLDMGGSDGGGSQVAAGASMNGETVYLKSLDMGESNGDTSSNGDVQGIDRQLEPR